MNRHTCHRTAALLLPLAMAIFGCARASTPLDLTSPDPGRDQDKIAAYYSREAGFYRLKAQELTERALVYEGLFGRNSDWVAGTRLLAQFYEETAREQDRLAGLHLRLAGHHQQEASQGRASIP